MRRVFLWAARNRWLKERLPRLRFMRRAVRRFMPGETLEDALAAAAPLQAAGIATMYTRLGENLESLAEADEVAEHYIERHRPDQGRRDRRRDLRQADPARPRPRRRRLPRPPRALAEHAAADRLVPLDRHGGQRLHRATIALYERLRAAQPATGICLQAYLRRTAADIERLLPLDPAIRLVKGAYDETRVDRLPEQGRASIRTTSALAVRFLLDGRGRPIRLGLGTHDVDAHRADRRAGRPGRASARDGFEVQMLYGIRTDQQYRLAKAGYRVEALIAYGDTGIRGTCVGWRSDRPT